MNKVEAQTQNMVKSSYGLVHPLKTTSLGDIPHVPKFVQIKKQIIESVSMASPVVQQLKDMITNTIRA